MHLVRHLLVSVILALGLGCATPPPPESSSVEIRPDFATHFEAAGVRGTFVLYDIENDHYLVHNPERADSAYIPASTFKIFNSLVALETGVIADEDEILPWDGVERQIKSWNRDQNLRSALKVSAVWFYQEMARRIGEERMRHYIEAAKYGNENIDGGIDRFWLDGEIRISPYEQIDFLVRLIRNDLPFSQATMDTVKDILVLEEDDRTVLRAKTGWGFRLDSHVGWWVGYVERDGKTYVFANNIAFDRDEQAAARVRIGRAILHDLELLGAQN